MKIRTDFVSNSSSSSFIVINRSGHKDKYEGPEKLVLPQGDPDGDYEEPGCCWFGWQTQKYFDMMSKLNWCALMCQEQLYYELKGGKEAKETGYSFSEMEAMLKRVCKKELGCEVEIKHKDDLLELDGPADSDDNGYIDHQSGLYERLENARMFKSDQMLADFITNSDSYIDNSNDNDGRQWKFENDEYDLARGGYYMRPKDYSGLTENQVSAADEKKLAEKYGEGSRELRLMRKKLQNLGFEVDGARTELRLLEDQYKELQKQVEDQEKKEGLFRYDYE